MTRKLKRYIDCDIRCVCKPVRLEDQLYAKVSFSYSLFVLQVLVPAVGPLLVPVIGPQLVLAAGPPVEWKVGLFPPDLGNEHAQ